MYLLNSDRNRDIFVSSTLNEDADIYLGCITRRSRLARGNLTEHRVVNVFTAPSDESPQSTNIPN